MKTGCWKYRLNSIQETPLHELFHQSAFCIIPHGTSQQEHRAGLIAELSRKVVLPLDWLSLSCFQAYMQERPKRVPSNDTSFNKGGNGIATPEKAAYAAEKETAIRLGKLA